MNKPTVNSAGSDNLALSEDMAHSTGESRAVADGITSQIQPSTVLQVGCGAGALVGLLRQAGVEAFGIDTTEQVATVIRDDLQPYCSVHSPVEPLSQRYDLIICLGGLQRLEPGQAEQAIARLCQHGDDVLFSPPSDTPTAEHLGESTSEYWAEIFARHDFFRDLDYDASFAGRRAVRYRRAQDAVQVIAAYERRLALLERESRARRDLNLSQQNELLASEHAAQAAKLRARDLETRWAELEGSPGWAVLQQLQILRARFAPPGSRREQAFEEMSRAFRVHGGWGPFYFVRRVGQAILWRLNAFLSRARVTAGAPLRAITMQVDEIETRPPLQAHRTPVEIVVCVHNALADVARCLESVVRHTTAPYSIILVDDGSGAETRDYLAEFASTHGAMLLRNEEPKRYTRAANQGLAHSSADYVVLLNSDTIVTPQWLDRMIACVESDPQIGMVGPLSNTASWQSIPQVESGGDWASNPLPPQMTPDDMGQLVARYSARSYPGMPFLNGFCLLLRQRLIQEIGNFDEESFGQGYGEEDDLALRARGAGWQLALADDAYVYHAQSRSYTSSTRKRLSERAGEVLAQKHGLRAIEEGVTACTNSPVLQGIRFRSRAMLDRRACIERGMARYAGLRVLFILPIAAPGGGGNVVIDEARAMREMGVDVSIFNLKIHQSKFGSAYPDLEIPVVFGDEETLVQLAREYDAVIATHNSSVEWLAQIVPHRDRPVRGYYIQGFEPYMYPEATEDYQRAWESYTLIPELVRFVKTEWTAREVKSKTNADCTVVGPSVNIDLFRPRPREEADWPERALRISAMIRPEAPYRAPRLTMELFRRASERYRQDIELVLFGTSLDDPGFAALPRDFPWKLAGVLSQKQVARLMNEVDIFVDFSSHQAMGLTAMEAMACGVAAIVPEVGGASCFARHEENCLVADTLSEEACWQSLRRLIEEHVLRARLQKNALADLCDHYPEQPAFNILSILFD
jgi:GT2 family glycosyltransferase/glycosyltransferase involved in cell wall biosynthesis